jgi:hypothetical protein
VKVHEARNSLIDFSDFLKLGLILAYNLHYSLLKSITIKYARRICNFATALTPDTNSSAQNHDIRQVIRMYGVITYFSLTMLFNFFSCSCIIIMTEMETLFTEANEGKSLTT